MIHPSGYPGIMGLIKENDLIKLNIIKIIKFKPYNFGKIPLKLRMS